MNNNDRKSILELLKQNSRIDFSLYHPSFFNKQVINHQQLFGNLDFDQYLNLLANNSKFVDSLISSLTVNVSEFFRNPLVFEVVNSVILADLITRKKNKEFSSIRIWSAGCSFGEEAYSIAILLMEALAEKYPEIKPEIFATDIDEQALLKARNGVYPENSIDNMRYHWVNKYFKQKDNFFYLSSKIREMVSFSQSDLLDLKHYAPQESIFGNFDICFCRNVLIYFGRLSQKRIFTNMYRSLAPNGYLILGETESIPYVYEKKFQKINQSCKIYQKI